MKDEQILNDVKLFQNDKQNKEKNLENIKQFISN